MKRKDRPRAKPGGFLPRYADKSERFEFSTYRIDGLGESEVWRIGAKHIEPRIRRVIPARCDLLAVDYIEQGLVLEFDNIPERHMNVVDWPSETEAQISLALELVSIVDEQGGFHDNPGYQRRSG